MKCADCGTEPLTAVYACVCGQEWWFNTLGAKVLDAERAADRRRIAVLEARLARVLRLAQPEGMWVRTVDGCQYEASRGRAWSRSRAPKGRTP